MKFWYFNVCDYVLEFYDLKHETRVQVVGFLLLYLNSCTV